MSEKYKARVRGELYFITITIIDWVDFLSRPIYKDVIVSSLNHCVKNKGLSVFAYCIMSNHVHAIVSCDGELSDVVRDMKKHTSKELIKAMRSIHESRREWMLKKFEYAAKRVKKGVNYKVWQDGYHPVHLSTNQMIDQRIDYIHNNPVGEGIVYRAEDYVYSSASFYFLGEESIVALQMLD